MLSYLVYVSQRSSSCSQKDINIILESCQRNNSRLQLTGVLLYSESKFVQYLEGEYDLVKKLFDDIKQDSRHTNVRTLVIGALKKREFPSWYMGAKKVDFKDVDFKNIKFLTENSTEDQLEVSKIFSDQKNTKAIDFIKKML